MKPTIHGKPKRFTSIVRDARALGVSRITLWRFLSGTGNLGRNPDVKERYEKLLAERAAAQTRGVVIPAGTVLVIRDRAYAARLSAQFPDSLQVVGRRILTMKPLILSANTL